MKNSKSGMHPSDLLKHALIISNEEMDDVMKIVKSLGESGLLITGVSENIQYEAKEQKRRFVIMFLSTLGGGLLVYLAKFSCFVTSNQTMI